MHILHFLDVDLTSTKLDSHSIYHNLEINLALSRPYTVLMTASSFLGDCRLLVKAIYRVDDSIFNWWQDTLRYMSVGVFVGQF